MEARAGGIDWFPKPKNDSLRVCRDGVETGEDTNEDNEAVDDTLYQGEVDIDIYICIGDLCHINCMYLEQTRTINYNRWYIFCNQGGGRECEGTITKGQTNCITSSATCSAAERAVKGFIK